MAAGVKTGGRTKGTPNKATAAQAAAVSSTGLTPLEFLTEVYRNERLDFMMRVSAAKAAAPYVHAALSSVDMALTGQVQLGGIRSDDVEGVA